MQDSAQHKNKRRRYPIEVLTPQEVFRLIRACSNRAPTGIRNRALIVTLYRSGLRLSEALGLFPKDLDRDAGTLRILHGKGDVARTVGLDPTGFAVIEKWLEVRRQRRLTGRSPVFCTLEGNPMQGPYVRALLRRLAIKAGIEKRVHAHGLRHTHAAELAREGYPMNLIQAQLGHKSLATTSRYLDHIAPVQLIDSMRQRVWKFGDLAAGKPNTKGVSRSGKKVESPPRGFREFGGVYSGRIEWDYLEFDAESAVTHRQSTSVSPRRQQIGLRKARFAMAKRDLRFHLDQSSAIRITRSNRLKQTHETHQTHTKGEFS